MKYGLIGKTLAHSYSMKIHNYLGNKEYILHEIAPEKLDEFMTKRDFLGINITMPYKEAVMKYCVLSDQAQKIGCVNTIVNKDGVLYGYNTDYFGFSENAKRMGISFAGQKVLILGGGGTSKTVTAVATDEGAKEVVVISRSGEDNYQNISRHYDADILVNTTPIGMYPHNDGMPLDVAPFTQLKAAMDAVYNPMKSNFLLQCKDIPTAGGLPMLAAQAVYAHGLFFDVDVSDLMQETIEHAMKIFSNYVFIGMPGTGKSTVGKLFSEKMGLKFVDTDDEIIKRTNEHPRDIINQKGEDVFRQIEAQVVADFAKENGYVIATGGGSVLLEKNRKAILQNGVVVLLDRPIEDLNVQDRPLSVNLEELRAKRMPIYKSVAHHMVQVEETPDMTVESVLKCIKKEA